MATNVCSAAIGLDPEGKPSEIVLDQVSKNVSEKWRSLLTHLGVPSCKIAAYPADPISACFQGLVFWREGNDPCRPPTWTVLLEAIEAGAERKDYACQLRGNHGLPGNLVQQQQQHPAVTNDSEMHGQVPISSGPRSLMSEGQPTQAVLTMDERSTKIQKIVDGYWSGKTKVCLPSNPDLEEELDAMMEILREKLTSANSGVIPKLSAKLQRVYRRYLYGNRPAPLPPIPDNATDLYEFIDKRSTPFEVFLVHHAVEILDCEKLKKYLQEYESNLAKHLQQELSSYKSRKVSLPQRNDYTHMTIVVSEQQVLLSLVLKLKEYFKKYLKLEEVLFEGFEEGCTVLFFSIQRSDAALLAPAPVILSHLGELKTRFAVTHLIVFGYFACDVEEATIELFDPVESLENNGKLRKENIELKSERDFLNNRHIAERNKFILKEKELRKKVDKSHFLLEEQMKERRHIKDDNDDDDDDNDVLSLKELHSSFVRKASRKAGLEARKNDSEVFRTDMLSLDHKLKSIQMPSIPSPTCRANAVVSKGRLFIGGGLCLNIELARLVHVYDFETCEWSSLPPAPQYNTELTQVSGQLTLVGGREVSSEVITDLISTWDEDKEKWISKIPSMPTKRGRPCIIHCEKFVLVAGGKESGDRSLLDSVDILDKDTLQWSTSPSVNLPFPMWGIRSCISNGYVYLTSAMDSVQTATKKAYRVPLEELTEAISSKQEIVWENIQDTPFYALGLVMHGDRPVVVGGYDGCGRPTANISVYDPTLNKWNKVGECSRPHFQSCCIAVGSSYLLVIGGRTDPTDAKSSTSSNFELLYA